MSDLDAIEARLREVSRNAHYDMDGLSGRRRYLMPDQAATRLHFALDDALDALRAIEGREARLRDVIANLLVELALDARYRTRPFSPLLAEAVARVRAALAEPEADHD